VLVAREILKAKKRMDGNVGRMGGEVHRSCYFGSFLVQIQTSLIVKKWTKLLRSIHHILARQRKY
jgi:hypothetical protein